MASLYALTNSVLKVCDIPFINHRLHRLVVLSRHRGRDTEFDMWSLFLRSPLILVFATRRNA